MPVAGPLVGAGAGGDARRTTLKTATPLRASKSCDHHSRAARGSVDRLRPPPPTLSIQLSRSVSVSRNSYSVPVMWLFLWRLMHFFADNFV